MKLKITKIERGRPSDCSEDFVKSYKSELEVLEDWIEKNATSGLYETLSVNKAALLNELKELKGKVK